MRSRDLEINFTPENNLLTEIIFLRSSEKTVAHLLTIPSADTTTTAQGFPPSVILLLTIFQDPIQIMPFSALEADSHMFSSIAS